MLSLYNALQLPLRPFALIWALWARRNSAGRMEASERLARSLPSIEPGGIWIHGSSVGEARIVAALAAAFRKRIPDRPLAVSAFTKTGRGQLPCRPAVDAAFFAPLDFRGLPGRLLDTMRPALVVIVETELWPNLLREAGDRAVPVVLVNGRVSPEKLSRYLRWKGLYLPLVAGIKLICAQSEEDADRFAELGAARSNMQITGNLKFDLTMPEVDEAALRRQLALPDSRPVFVAGSTGPGEEQLVLDAFGRAREICPELHLIIAPRHPERSGEVERLLAARRLTSRKLSESPAAADGDPDVLLVDGIGQLGKLYKLGMAAFVGGSLIPSGGHNVLEPAALGVPVLFGPHTETFAEPAAMLERAGGGKRVADAEELGRELSLLLGNPERRGTMASRAERLVAANRGALERSVDLIISLPELS
jgi:3-deoxy-D-manno-octulosonic-acid transferase